MSSRAGVALYVAKKVLATIPVAAVVTAVVFLLSHIGPGDPAAVLAGSTGAPRRSRRSAGSWACTSRSSSSS